jgi:cellulose synthase/poly-beta-1,6-N-acetylglucosamine synthase-like glycosyltransferase
VALLTTFVPSREPIDLLASTLEAMVAVRYEHGTLDVWVLDEGDDPAVRALAARLGVHHFSRRDRPEFNQASGPWRAHTKHGNHNAWRAVHEHGYDVVAHLDPEHAPLPDFFERTLGYFHDPDVAFVVTPHVYGNRDDGFVAAAAATHFYPFIGLLQRGGNRIGTPMLIGANHMYRTATWQQIGGYQDSITEDHLTGLVVHASTNPATGCGWKGIYTPDVVSVGEAPTTFTDYFNQQKRWAHGTTEVAMQHSPSLLRRMPAGQRLGYLALQAYYPALAMTWLLTSALLVVTLTTGDGPLARNAEWLLPIWLWANVGQYGVLLWLRRFYLAPHERRALALDAVLLTAITAPVYCAAVVGALARRPVRFVVTGKGDLARADGASTFRYHLAWLAVVAVALGVSIARGGPPAAVTAWVGVAVVVAAVPIAIAFMRAGPIDGMRRRRPHRQGAPG